MKLERKGQKSKSQLKVQSSRRSEINRQKKNHRQLNLVKIYVGSGTLLFDINALLCYFQLTSNQIERSRNGT